MISILLESICFWRGKYHIAIHRYHSGEKWEAYSTTLYHASYNHADLVARELLRALDRYEDSILTFEISRIKEIKFK